MASVTNFCQISTEFTMWTTLLQRQVTGHAHLPVGLADIAHLLHTLHAGRMVEAGVDDGAVLLPQSHSEAVNLEANNNRHCQRDLHPCNLIIQISRP